MGVTIRQAELDDPRDAAAIVELTDMYMREPIAMGRPLPQDARRRLVPAIKQHGGVMVLLAVEDGEAVGILTAIRTFSTFLAEPVLNVHDVAVVPPRRGRGIGAALLAAAEEAARTTGCGRMTLEVVSHNQAKRLYERAGFGPMAEFWVKEIMTETERSVVEK